MTEPAGERWLPIADFEDAYEVSDLGRLRSIARVIEIAAPRSKPYRRFIRERVLKPIESNGCLIAVLWREGVPAQFRIATIVANAFLGERPPGQELGYRDANPRNLALENLVYGSHDELWANRRAKAALPARERHGRAVLTEADVEYVRTASHGSSLAVLGAQVGVSKSQVHRIVRGEQWTGPRVPDGPLPDSIADIVRAIARGMAADDAAGVRSDRRPQ